MQLDANWSTLHKLVSTIVLTEECPTIFLVEARLKLVGGWRSAGRMDDVRNVLKVSELNNSVKERAYQESLRGKYEVWRVGDVESVEKKWETFRDIVMECTKIYVA